MNDRDFIELVLEQLKQVRRDGDEPPELGHLLAALCAKQAGTVDQLALKLAVWRWARFGDEAAPALSASDRLVYSIFRDAVRLAGRTDLATDTDHATDFLADLLTRAA